MILRARLKPTAKRMKGPLMQSNIGSTLGIKYGRMLLALPALASATCAAAAQGNSMAERHAS